MPKGDRLKLKADPEDGTTPVANLLLEAVAMAKISGLQKGAILYLWRRTYGWQEPSTNKRMKERKIPLSEWKNALDSEKSRISKTLRELEAMGIIKRRVADMWGGYYYAINTNIKSWNSNSINIAKLSDMITVGDFSTVGENATVGENNNSSPKRRATVGENATQQLAKTPLPSLYKERLKKDKEIYDDKNNKTGLIFKTFDDNFQRITESNREVLGDYIDRYGADEVLIALEKSIKQNKRSLAYVEGILKKGGGTKSTGKYSHMIRR